MIVCNGIARAIDYWREVSRTYLVQAKESLAGPSWLIRASSRSRGVKKTEAGV